MADKLKPCPFCGEETWTFSVLDNEDKEGTPCRYVCEACAAGSPWAYCGMSDGDINTMDDMLLISKLNFRPIESALLSRAEAAEAKLASCSEADAVSYRDGVIADLQNMLDDQIAIAEAAASQLRAAVDAYEKAEAKLEKVRLWAAEHLDDGCDCSIEYRSRKMVDPGCQWHDLEVERLDAILAPGGES